MKTATNQNIRPLLVMAWVYVYLAVFSIQALQGQNLSSYKNNQKTKIDSTLNEYKNNNKKGFLSLLPSVNYNFMTGASVGFNLSNFINYNQTKQRNKIELKRLEFQLQTSLKNEINQAELKEQEIFNIYNSIKIELEILKEKFDLFKIISSQYENNEIPLSTFKSSKINYMNSYKNVINAIDKLSILIINFDNSYNYKPIEINSIIKTAKSFYYE